MSVRLFASFLVVALVACAHGRGGPAPEPLVVQSLAPTFGEEGQGHLDLVLELDNTGASLGRVSGMGCDVFINQRWFAATEGLLSLSLAPNEKRLVVLHIPWALRRAQAVASPEDAVDLEVRGYLELNRGRGLERLAFAKKSRMHVENPPRASDDPL